MYNDDDIIAWAKKFSSEAPDVKPSASVSGLLERMRGATFGQESGGHYRVTRNARTGAVGGFQVLPANIPNWTKTHYGRSLTPNEFERNPQAQEAVFTGEMGKYLRRAKSRGVDDDTAIRMGAAQWYGGEGAIDRYDNPNRFRPNEPSFREYTQSVLNRSKSNQPKQVGMSEDDINRIFGDVDKVLGTSINDKDIFAEIDKVLKQPTPNIVPETPKTQELQRQSAVDPKVKTRGAVLLNPGEVPDFKDPKWKDFEPIYTPDERYLMIHKPSAKKLKLRNKADMQMFVDKNPEAAYQRLLGIAYNAPRTDGDQSAVTAQVNGVEAASHVVDSSETAAKQKEIYKDQFPTAQVADTTTGKIAQQRVQSGGGGVSRKARLRPSPALTQEEYQVYLESMKLRGQQPLSFEEFIKQRPQKVTESAVTGEYDEQGNPVETASRKDETNQPQVLAEGTVKIDPNWSDEEKTRYTLTQLLLGRELVPNRKVTAEDIEDWIAGAKATGNPNALYRGSRTNDTSTLYSDTTDSFRDMMSEKYRTPEVLAEEAKQRAIAPPTNDEYRKLAYEQLKAEKAEANYLAMTRRGETPALEPTEEEITTRIAELQAAEPDMANKSEAYDIAQKRPSLVRGAYGAVGSAITKLGGVLRPVLGSGNAVSRFGLAAERIPSYANRGQGAADLTETIGEFLGATPAQLGELAWLPGGAVAKFATLHGLHSAGRGENPKQVVKEIGFGGATGAAFQAGTLFKNPVAKLGTVFGGSATVNAAAGMPIDQNLQSSIVNTLFDAYGLYGQRVVNKFTRFWKGGEPLVVGVTPKGEVVIPRSHDVSIANDIILDPENKAYKNFKAYAEKDAQIQTEKVGQTTEGAIVDMGTPKGQGVAQLKEQRDVEREKVVTDTLTKVASRASLDKALPTAEKDPNTQVVVFDANNFGQINKVSGQEAGDKALIDMAGAIKQAASEFDNNRVFRRGGDEFVVLANKDVADQIRQRAEEIYGTKKYGDVEVSITGTASKTFNEADSVLQAAKTAKKEKGFDVVSEEPNVSPKPQNVKEGRVDDVNISELTLKTVSNPTGYGERTNVINTKGDVINTFTLPQRAKDFIQWYQNPDRITKIQGKQLGDFYEFFDKNAEIASLIFDTTLTKNRQGQALTAVPLHALESYRAKAKRLGITIQDVSEITGLKPVAPETGKPTTTKAAEQSKEPPVPSSDKFNRASAIQNNTTKLVEVVFGGSNRKYNNEWEIIKPFSYATPIRSGLGSKMFNVKVLDTPEIREHLKSAGIRVKKTSVLDFVPSKFEQFASESGKLSAAPPVVKSEPLTVPKEYGASNTRFTRDKAETAKAFLRNKFGKESTKVGSGGLQELDADTVKALKDIAGFHLEAGVKKLGELADRVATEVGEWARPHIERIYAGMADKDFVPSKFEQFASESNKLSPKQTDTPEFKKWFGDSKVVDKNGEPLVVYHGTPKGNIEFQDRDKGIYFSGSRQQAETYTYKRFMRTGSNRTLIPVYLSLQNPLVIDALGKRHDNIPVPWKTWKPKVFGNLPDTATSIEEAFQYALKKGHDGLIVKNVVDTLDPYEKEKGDVYAVKSVAQIKKESDRVDTSFNPAELESKPKAPKPKPPTIAKPVEPPPVAEMPKGAPTGQTPSKIAKSIETKAIEQGLTEGFPELAGYDKKHVQDQIERVGKIVETDIAAAREMALGLKPVPPAISPVMLLRGMEAVAKAKKDAQLQYELANSPLVSETSYHAQEMRFMREREQDSATTLIQELRQARNAKVSKWLKGRTLEEAIAAETEAVAKSMNGHKRAIKTKESWQDFISSIEC